MSALARLWFSKQPELDDVPPWEREAFGDEPPARVLTEEEIDLKNNAAQSEADAMREASPYR